MRNIDVNMMKMAVGITAKIVSKKAVVRGAQGESQIMQSMPSESHFRLLLVKGYWE